MEAYVCIFIFTAPDEVSEDNFKMIFLTSSSEIPCDPSLEPSRHGSSNEGSPLIFYSEILEIIPR